MLAPLATTSGFSGHGKNHPPIYTMPDIPLPLTNQHHSTKNTNRSRITIIQSKTLFFSNPNLLDLSNFLVKFSNNMEMLVLNVLDCSWIPNLLGLSGGGVMVVGGRWLDITHVSISSARNKT